RPGRPAIGVTIQDDAVFVIGVQVGVGFVRLGLMDAFGATTGTDAFEYDTEMEPTDVFERIGAAIRSLLELVPSEKVRGVGVTVPGPVDPYGRTLLLPLNLPWRDVPIADILEPIVDRPVTVDHNVRTMALAEARFGSGRGLDSVAFVYLRTGLGAGLVLDGQPFAGGMRGAIALGHVRVVEDGLPCICGSSGCLETIVSGPALAAAAERLNLTGNSDPLTLLWEAAQEDLQAAEVVDEIVEHLALALSTLVNLLNPELLLLGGSLATTPDSFVTRLEQGIRQAVFPLIRETVRIEASNLGMDAGVAGGGTLALERYFYS
ncbi:MAG: ROK family protein, partial [Actinomycetia bacterium]|nr:ROK family protein [Actinomycetes bacterium]